MKVNIGYAWAQLAKARAAAQHAEGKARARAEAKLRKWEDTIAGMQAGTIAVGSRTPTKAPAWVTLDVVTGGFATGGYSAGGPLRDRERALAADLGLAPSLLALNLHYLVSPDATALLEAGCYCIDVPEQGALLAIAWLRARGDDARANELVETIAPWFAILRFFPMPAEHSLEDKDTVRLQELAVTLQMLATDRRQRCFETMRDTVQVWKPLRARALTLFAETAGVDGFLGATFPDGWHARVAEVVADLAHAGTPTTTRAHDTGVLDRDARTLRERSAFGRAGGLPSDPSRDRARARRS